ncbi:MAG: MerR family transcriptional regulator [bacterium]
MPPITSPPPDLPNKIFYSISEVSEYTGIEPHVLRYWETKFSRLCPKRVGGNQRKYTRSDLDLLYEIIHLLHNEGYTLDGAERKLRSGVAQVRAEREAANRTESSPEETDSKQLEAPSDYTSHIHEIREELASIVQSLV